MDDDDNFFLALLDIAAELVCAAAPLLLALVIMAACFGGGYLWERAECHNVGQNAGVATRYELIGGCFVKTGGRWIPAERWRVTTP